jgi:UDP-N-acetylglucosamine acyltransferase
MSRGSEEGGGLTEVGDHGFFMAYSHIAHDCRVGNHVIFANNATLAGHCVVGDHVFIGGLTAVQQFGWIGAHAMVGGLTGVRTDIIPFAIASGDGPRLTGINTIGMQRRNFSKETIRTVRAAYRLLFFGEGLLQARIAAAEQAHASDPAVAAILEFIRAPRKRPLAHPRSGASED